MHELAIVRKIIAAADLAAEKNGIARVGRLRLRLGRMAAARPDELKFGFETYAKGSRLDGAELAIEEVKVIMECRKCLALFNDDRFDDDDFAHTIAHAPLAYLPPPCHKCGAEGAKIVHGQELELIGIEGE